MKRGRWFEPTVVHLDASRQSAREHLFDADHAMFGTLRGEELADAVLRLESRERL